MKKTKILFVIAITIVYFFVSCSEDEKVERPYMYHFSDLKSTVYDLTNVVLDVSYDGPQQATAIDVLFEVDATKSTAVEGVDFDLTSTIMQIPANSSFTTLNFETLPLESGVEKKVVFNITQGGFIISTASKNTHTVTIKGPVVGFDKSGAKAYDTIVDPFINAAINLVGTKRSVAQSIGFTVDTLSTAVAGVHYDMVSPGTEVNLAANAAETQLAFDIIPGCMSTTTDDVQLILKINNLGDLVPNSNSKYTFTFLAPRVEFVKTDSVVDNDAGNVNIELQLVGPAVAFDRTIVFEIDSVSTAISGLQYDVVTASPVLIPANQKAGIITLNVLDGMTSQFQDLSVIVKLKDTGDLGIGTDDEFTLTIKKP